MHELAKDVHCKDNIRTSNGQVNKVSNKSAIDTRIGKECAILIDELQVLFHGKQSDLRTKLATIIQNIKNIFLLVEEDAFWGNKQFQDQRKI